MAVELGPLIPGTEAGWRAYRGVRLLVNAGCCKDNESAFSSGKNAFRSGHTSPIALLYNTSIGNSDHACTGGNSLGAIPCQEVSS